MWPLDVPYSIRDCPRVGGLGALFFQYPLPSTVTAQSYSKAAQPPGGASSNATSCTSISYCPHPHFRHSLSSQASDSGLHYLSGLWREDLLWGLMWRNVGNSTSYIYRSPSWSWTALDTGVLHEDMGSSVLPLKVCAEVLDASVVVCGLNPFGKVTSGKVT
jgi:hypothetical protein